MTTPVYLLNEVCEINPRLSRGHSLADETAVSFVPMAAIDEEAGAIRDRQARVFGEVKKGYTYFKNGDVLFAKITPCMENGKAAVAGDLVGGVGFGSTEFHVLRARNMVLPEWLHYFLRRESFRQEAKRNFTGTAGQQRVPASFMANAHILVPSLAEQRRIIDLLSRAEGIVRLRREAKAKIAAVIPALFIKTFGNPTENPKKLPLEQLGKLLSVPIRNGISPSKSGRFEGRVLTLSAITSGAFDRSAIKRAMFAAPLAKNDEVSARDFLVCRGNGNKSLVGVGCFPDQDLPGVAFPDTAIAVRPRRDVLLPHFLSVQWQCQWIRYQIDAIAKTTNGTFKINQAGLSEVKIILPPLSAQFEFSERILAMESIIRQQADALQKAESAFHSLLAAAFRTEHRAVESSAMEAYVA